MSRITYGLDVAKRVFQMYWVEPDTGKICNRRFSRPQLIEFLSQSAPAQVVLEACGSEARARCPREVWVRAGGRRPPGLRTSTRHPVICGRAWLSL